ncbi:hypothetical protein K469DRAFT_597528 [Zopfia rhizophila CBS 207.26]|uniref:Tat pathway signal sequence n=1 Tax=Zopfia rhizophila CBS 207.26 TaxID=1314779 RepID=A0A6A6DJB8_9PEZI|nr:hypothetical protein K469DRAFT_597528 [Zopfia rhizophila CBS 207.26]
MNWDAFHEKAKNAIPAQELPAKRFWIGVLIHTRSPEGDVHESDFIWMKAHAKVAFNTIESQYKMRYPGVDIELKSKDDKLAPTVIVKDINHYEDNVIIFQAVEKPGRVPLQPVKRQLTNEPRESPLDAVKPTMRKLIPPFAPIPSENSPTNSVQAARSPLTSPLTQAPAQKQNFEHVPRPQLNDMQISCVSDIQTAPPMYPDPPTYASAPKYPPTLHPYLQGYITPYGAPQASNNETPNAFGGSNYATPIKEEKISNQSNPTPPRELQVPFDPESVFKKDPSPEPEPQSQGTPTDECLRQLLEQPRAELLEAGVSKALKVLKTLKGSFSQHTEASPDAQRWIDTIGNLEKQAERKRTVVGVVGNTGAGKSSVINALLDEERLVPTNCMRACTAVVTELSWNHDNSPFAKYRAEIEFISREEWAKELDMLLREMLTETGTVSKDTADQDSDAGIAWAKFHAVFPQKTKDMLAQCDVRSLMAENSVLDVLGTTKKIAEARPEPFYKQLQHFVDSKEKVTGKEKKGKKKEKREMEYWPLIKVVKIYTKSPALSTGAVIVDLPGVHDSNAARAAVAQGYIKQCTGLWIVAPITRAVDDKAAKTLLGDSFKRQLKYDGGFSSVTFICSKTDDISITEATDSLELEDEISQFDDKERDLKRQRADLKRKVDDLKESKAVYKEAMDSAEDDLEAWEKLLDEFNVDKPVYAPKNGTKKRKRASSGKRGRKRRQRSSPHSDDDFVVSDSDSDASEQTTESEEVEDHGSPLTEDEIHAKIKDLRNTKKNARRTRAEIDLEINDLAKEITEIDTQLKSIRAEMSAICIAGRNEYSKEAIQKDFAAGIKELDQENAAEEDEENFNPDDDLRDYDEVAGSLPVFCVSSRAYQKMCGRLRKDDPVPGFKTAEETEMPQLQAHCKKLTEAGRIQSCRSFLVNLNQVLNSLSFWASSDGSGLKLTDAEKREEANYLNKRLDDLEKGLEKAVESCISMMKNELAEQIFDKYPEVIEEAASAAPGTAEGWGAHKLDGGLHWCTYKAVVRRDGVYQSKTSGLRDFNSELNEPITKRLATGWERAFQHRLPKTLEKYAQNSSQILHDFHYLIEQHARQNGAGIASLQMLGSQIYNYEQLFKELGGHLHNHIMELQRTANREFTPVIASLMHAVYDACAQEHGSGSFMRMKRNMIDYVKQHRHQMFKDATENVKGQLEQMCRQVEEDMSNKADEIFVSMRRDYVSLIGGAEVNQDNAMSKAERLLRAEIKSLLMGVDEQFRAIANGEIGEEIEDQDIEDELLKERTDLSDDETASDSRKDFVNDDAKDETTIAESSTANASDPKRSKPTDTSPTEEKSMQSSSASRFGTTEPTTNGNQDGSTTASEPSNSAYHTFVDRSDVERCKWC